MSHTSSPKQAKNVVLIGFMGTGKSSAGRLAAERLGLRLVDMDTMIEERAGKKISDIFAEDGEAHFRALESKLAAELGHGHGMVIATGGGVVLNPANIPNLGRHGVVVCLRADPDVILKRVAQHTHRPLLETGEKAKAIVDLLKKRKPLYDAIPNQIDTSRMSVEAVAERIVELYETED